MTLLRCVGTISRQGIASRPWAAGPDIATPAGQMIGRTEFKIGFLRLTDPARLPVEWERFALPILTLETRGRGTAFRTGMLMDVDLGDALLSSIRLTQTGIELRAWNPSAMRPASVVLAGRTDTIGPARIVTFPMS
jgi:hypothetical protein